jgi:hypothetical protein
MTREEAEAKISGIVGHTEAFRYAWIDAYVALGMLKLDEPKCASERAVDAMFDAQIAHSGILTPRYAIEAISKAGLKIVKA